MKARRSESVSGLSLTSWRQEKVAVPLFSTSSTVCAIRLKGRAVSSSLTSPRLTPASPVSSAPVNPRIEGSPAMISISGAAFSNCEVILPTSFTGRNNSPFLSKNSPEPSGCWRYEVLGIALKFLLERPGGGTRQFRRRRFHHGQDRAVAVERRAELLVALAPIQIGRNQRVDVGVDREVTGCVVAGRDRQNERDQDSERSKPRAGFDNRYNNTCQHIFSFSC